MFHGQLVPSIYDVNSAIGYSNKLQMGTVVSSVAGDDGVEHAFTLLR